MDISRDSNSAPVYIVTDNRYYDEDIDGTDVDMAMSEVSSCRTMSTLSSGEVADYFQTLHGFTYVTDENIPIAFPTDSVAERINIVFNIITRLCQGGKNVPAAADELLLRGGLDGNGARVLNLVTNSGVWAHEVAAAYPNAEIVSLDVKPLTALAPHARINFEVYDLYAGIAEPDASFDLVHARQCVTLTKDYNFLLREMHRVLKPGGILVIGEMPSQSYEANNPSVLLHSSPRRVEAVRMMRAAHASQGIDITAWDDMPSRLDSSHPMWGNHDSKGDQHTIRGFHTITSFAHLIPSGPWPTNEEQRAIGAMAKLIFEKVWKALLPMLQISGMKKSEAEAFVASVEEEVKDPKYRSYTKYKVWCARKI